MQEKLAQLEGLLYVEGGEVPRAVISKSLQLDDNTLDTLIKEYNAREGGLVMLFDNAQVLLRPVPQVMPLLTQLCAQESRVPLSKASLETLAVICYQGGTTAAEVEYIRGVNANHTLRQLAARGLVHKHKSGGTVTYMPTAKLYAHLGIITLDELPEREAFNEAIQQFKHEYVGNE